MSNPIFTTEEGVNIPFVTETQMRAVDRIAVEDFGLGVLQMMENAGRNLALAAIEMLPEDNSNITILAGPGGNGGGGICCARHLINHGYPTSLLLSKIPSELRGSAKSQLSILTQTGFQSTSLSLARETIQAAALVIDALIGYSLRGAPRGNVSELIKLTNLHATKILSLDLPSGVESTTGETPGTFVQADRTLTLALPKPGLLNPVAGEIYLADIGIPLAVYQSLGIQVEPFFGDRYQISLKRSK